jgi:hypothetical protein
MHAAESLPDHKKRQQSKDAAKGGLSRCSNSDGWIALGRKQRSQSEAGLA